jgi:hypothetical protein
MEEYSKEEYAQIEKLTEYAYDTTYYQISCDFCDTQGEREEYHHLLLNTHLYKVIKL